jgi:branched-chain amino acid transport system permease protein
MNRRFLGYGALLVVGMAVPFLFYPTMIMKVLCFGLFACAFNLLIGYTGLLSFGHAVFFGTSAYVVGYSTKSWGLPPEMAILVAVFASAGLGFLFGSLAIRRQGIYFAMITLALSQMMYFVFLQAPFTGGEDGMHGIPRGRLLGLVDLSSDVNMYYFVFGIFVFGFWMIHRIIHSPFGEILKAIRENESRAISLGYDVNRYKLMAFVLSAGLSGLAGGTKALVFQFATLTDAHWHASGEVVLMTLLGGLGTVLGPLVGAAIVVVLQNTLADKVGSMITVIIGSIFVLCVLLFRRGVAGELVALYKNVVGGREGNTQRSSRGWTGSPATPSATAATQAKH